MSPRFHFRCTACGRDYDAARMRYRCGACGDDLDVVDVVGPGAESAVVDAAIESEGRDLLTRWLPVLPILQPALIPRVSLGESQTPLLAAPRLGARIGLERLALKCEFRFPTLSLKDRSMPLMVLKAIEYGADTVAIVSSGNASASLAAYAARAGLHCVVFMSAGASPAQVAKTIVHGAITVRMNTSLQAMSELFIASRDRLGWYDCNGVVNPFRVHGKKTMAYEIAWQHSWEAPDVVLIPTGNGSGMAAAGIGFQELHELGLIDRLPRLVAVQLESCAPIHDAFRRGAPRITPMAPGESVARALMSGAPDAGNAALSWVRRTDGFTATVSDAEILAAMSWLATDEGVFSDSAGAVTTAAAAKLRREGAIAADESVVCSVSGHGLNQPDLAFQLQPEPGLVAADPDAIAAYVRQAITSSAAPSPAGRR